VSRRLRADAHRYNAVTIRESVNRADDKPPMTSVDDNLRQLRQALPRMEAERDALPADSVFRPSPMWEDLRRFFDFIFDFSDRSLRNIRLHTSLMTGDPWFAHMAHTNLVTDEQKLTRPMIQQYHKLIADIPERFRASEPVTTPETEAVGIRYKGCLVTDDLIRYQRCVSNLYWSGIYRMLDALPGKPVIVEIGGGYGGLAQQITACFGKPCAYVIFDLPEMLYWSAAFLIVNNPDKRFYIYAGQDVGHASLADICAEHDFVFFPNYAFDLVAELPELHLLVNLLSFQEMTDEQVRYYASVAARHMRGALYSENRARHVQNTDMATTVHDVLAQWFDLTPDPALWRRLYPGANTFDDPRLQWQLFPYVGRARHDATPLVPIDRVMHTSDRLVRLDALSDRG
jgi:hypothetical protein